ncbi:hypothetical protein [Caballeronia sp. LZ043]|uniref:hypothetical protein n=1 Tax=Caballeronia sp. LZ043 TaxID=3038569 RepID=UPI00286AEEA2|nr:hypothetical protein [Caballeronia sp. LZ043]
MEAHGFKVPRAVDTVAKFFEIIEASKQASEQRADRIGSTYGDGIHAVTFFSANDMLYRGERFNLQWAKAGKKCEPVNGSATISGMLNGKSLRGGLRALLVRQKSILPQEWNAIRLTAQEAEMRVRARDAMQYVKAAREAQRAELDATGLFDTFAPAD